MLDSYVTINVLGLIGAAIAVLMVGWALFLIQSRIITLESTIPKAEGSSTDLTIEVQKALKVQVRNSVIALFAVAAIFMGLSFYFVHDNRPRSVVVRGEIQSEDNSVVTVSFSTQWQSLQTTGGVVRGEIWPERVDFVNVDIATPGHEPGQIIAVAEHEKDHNGELFFKAVRVGKKVVDKPAVVTEASVAVKLAPLSQ